MKKLLCFLFKLLFLIILSSSCETNNEERPGNSNQSVSADSSESSILSAINKIYVENKDSLTSINIDTSLVGLFSLKKGTDIFKCLDDGDIEKTIFDEYYKDDKIYVRISYLDCVTKDTFSMIEFGYYNSLFQKNYKDFIPEIKWIKLERNGSVYTNEGVELGLSLDNILELKGRDYLSLNSVGSNTIELKYFQEEEMYVQEFLFLEKELVRYTFGYTAY